MTYFGPLMRFTGMYVSSPAEAEEIVSDTFLAILEQPQTATRHL
ncbi:hypothetical protein NXW71_11400 [Parabacteroides merdae]|nr:hypothetical protein [Parabacteroides merdae]